MKLALTIDGREERIEAASGAGCVAHVMDGDADAGCRCLDAECALTIGGREEQVDFAPGAGCEADVMDGDAPPDFATNTGRGELLR